MDSTTSEVASFSLLRSMRISARSISEYESCVFSILVDWKKSMLRLR